MSVHPTRQNIQHVPRSNAVHRGLNRDTAPLRDDGYRRCKQCGHMCHLDRDTRSSDGARSGDGISHTADAGMVPDNPTVGAGCPFCGSLRWG